MDCMTFLFHFQLCGRCCIGNKCNASGTDMVVVSVLLLAASLFVALSQRA